MGYLYFIYLSCFIFVVHSQTTTVDTTVGKVQGLFTSYGTKQLTKFLGIPFAKPPVGHLRLMKPEKLEKWTNVKQATSYSASCYELSYLILEDTFIGAEKYNQSEDCLYLNIFVPGNVETARSNPKAVMFWIYGGGWIYGNANTYPGDSLAVTEDVIVVTFNYRLGLFGFMTLDDDTIPGNVGLFDQHAALRWVNDNIAAFGGDVSRVTIFGESAGADSVYNHLVSPLSNELFSRAIIMSAPTATKLPTKEKQYSKIKPIIKDVCATDSSNDLLECLQRLSIKDFRQVNDAAALAISAYVILDGEFLTDNPATLISKGEFDQSKEIIVGYMTDDGDIAVQYSNSWKTVLETGLSMSEAKEFIPNILYFYFPEADIPNANVMRNLLYQKYLSCTQSPFDIVRGLLNLSTDGSFASRAFEIAIDVSKYGGKVYLYEFEHLLQYFKRKLGANMKLFGGHGHDVFYLFGYLDKVEEAGYEVTQQEKQLSLSFMRTYAEFARTGNPKFLTNSFQQVDWKPYNEVTKQYLRFTDNMTTASLQTVSANMWSRITTWRDVLTGIQNMETCDAYFGDATPKTNKGSSSKSGKMVDIILMVVVCILWSCNWN